MVTDSWPQNDSDEGFPPVEEEPVVEPSHALAGAVGPATPVKASATAGGRIVQAARGISKQAHIVFAGNRRPKKLESRVRSLRIPSLMRKSPTVRRDLAHGLRLGRKSTRSLLTTETKRRTSLSSTHGFLRRPKAVCCRTSLLHSTPLTSSKKPQNRRSDKGTCAGHGHAILPPTLVFDGADHWLNICETVMKIED